MSVKDFNNIVEKLKSFKQRLEKEDIDNKQQQTMLRLFLAEITEDRVNVKMLQKI